MGQIVDAVFGGSAKDAARAQNRATQDAMKQFKEGTAEAKREIMPRFESAEMERYKRTQQSMDVLKQGFMPQMDVINQGNMNAQNTIAQAAPQMANAILGGDVNFESLQPQGINFDAMGFLGGMPDVEAPEMSPQPQMGPMQFPNGQPFQSPAMGFLGGQGGPIGFGGFNQRQR